MATVSRGGFLLVAVVLLLAALGAKRAGDSAERIAILAAIEGPIGPASVRHVEDVVETAEERGATVLVLRLNTPGGLATSMREIIAEILRSPVPVVGYVAPPGAHAASAGTYILYATHLAAMAPGTNLGSATPVQLGGGGGLPGMPSPEEGERGRDGDMPGHESMPSGQESSEESEAGNQAGDEPGDAREAPADAMTAKVVNDAVAFIRSLAEMHGRNADWAERAVREAASLSAEQALERNVINFLADDVAALLATIDGASVRIGGSTIRLATEGLAIERVEPDLLTQALGILANPNIAFILMMIGVYGLIFEFSNPGSIGPGVVGIICLVLGLYALNQLPLDYAGLALVVLGIAFMVAEALTPTFGVLGLGGLVAFIIGSAMLIDTEAPAYRLSWWVIGTTAATSGAILVLLLGYVWRAHRRPPTSGTARMLDAQGEVLDWSGGEGHVWAEGERWHARGEGDFAAGDPVRIRAMDGLTLVVAPASEGSTSANQERDEKGA